MLPRSLAAFAAALVLLPASASADITFQYSGSMTQARAAHSQAVLPDGRVLVAGGQTSVAIGSSPTATAELYNPATETWTNTAPMSTARVFAATIRLASGKVLVIGGTDKDPAAPLNTAEIYDPAAGAWAAAGSMTVGRALPMAGLIADGKVLVTGGGSKSSEIWDPATATFTPGPPTAGDHATGGAATLPDGDLLVAGGEAPERYDAATNTWGPAGTLPDNLQVTGPIVVGLADGRVLLTGGSGAAGATNLTTAIYSPATNTWTAAAPLPFPTMGAASVRMADGDVMLVGGVISAIIGGGIGGGGDVSTSLRYDVPTNTWVPTGKLVEDRFFPGASLLGNGKVLATGGISFTTFGVARTTELYPGVAKVFAPAISFGSVTVKQASATYLLPLRSSSHTTVRITGATVGGPHAADFTVDSADCVGRALELDQPCLLVVQFTPGATGARSATIDLAGNVAATNIPISGVGAAKPVTASNPGKVLCKAKQKGKKKKIVVKCKIKGAKKRSARLTRAGRTVARGTAARLTADGGLEPGGYTLRIGRISLPVHVG